MAANGNPHPDPPDERELDGLRSAVGNLERRLAVLEERERQEPWHSNLSDFLPAMQGSPGFVVDEGVARATPCTEIELDGGRSIVYSKGVVGALDDAQKALFCAETIKKPVSEPQRQRISAFQDAADTCKGEIAEIPEGDRLPPWLSCMAREARQRGVEL